MKYGYKKQIVIMVKDFINTYTVSGITYLFTGGALKVLLIKNNDGTIGFPGGKESRQDNSVINKTFEREFDEEVPSATKLVLGEKQRFYEITKKRDDDTTKKMIHYFLMTQIKNEVILFENGTKEFFIPWKEVFLINNLRPGVIVGLTAFIFKLKQEAEKKSSIKKGWDSVYQKNDDLRFFCQAVQPPDNTGFISIKNHLALGFLGITERQLKPS